MRAEPFSFLHYGNIPSMSYVSNKGKNVKFEIRDVAANDMPQVRVMAWYTYIDRPVQN